MAAIEVDARSNQKKQVMSSSQEDFLNTSALTSESETAKESGSTVVTGSVDTLSQAVSAEPEGGSITWKDSVGLILAIPGGVANVTGIASMSMMYTMESVKKGVETATGIGAFGVIGWVGVGEAIISGGLALSDAFDTNKNMCQRMWAGFKFVVCMASAGAGTAANLAGNATSLLAAGITSATSQTINLLEPLVDARCDAEVSDVPEVEHGLNGLLSKSATSMGEQAENGLTDYRAAALVEHIVKSHLGFLIEGSCEARFLRKHVLAYVTFCGIWMDMDVPLTSVATEFDFKVLFNTFKALLFFHFTLNGLSVRATVSRMKFILDEIYKEHTKRGCRRAREMDNPELNREAGCEAAMRCHPPAGTPWSIWHDEKDKATLDYLECPQCADKADGNGEYPEDCAPCIEWAMWLYSQAKDEMDCNPLEQRANSTKEWIRKTS